MRLFIAIELDETTRAAVVDEQRRLAAALRRNGDDGDFRPVRPEQLHLTLIFLGEVDEALVPLLVRALEPALARPAYRLAFGRAGMFPPRGNPRVLWLGLAVGADDTGAVHAEVGARVALAGATLEDRPFTPHLTIGRWRDGRSRHRAAIDGLGSPARLAEMTVDRVTLFQSRLAESGAVHTPLVSSFLR